MKVGSPGGSRAIVTPRSDSTAAVPQLSVPDDMFLRSANSKPKTVQNGADLSKWQKAYDAVWNFFDRALSAAFWFVRWLCRPAQSALRKVAQAFRSAAEARAKRKEAAYQPADARQRLMEQEAEHLKDLARQVVAAGEDVKVALARLKLSKEQAKVFRQSYREFLNASKAQIDDLQKDLQEAKNSLTAATAALAQDDEDEDEEQDLAPAYVSA